MARTNPKDAPADFDDLLGEPVPEEAEAVSENEDTPEQIRIRELEALLAKPLPAPTEEVIFEADTEKTPEQLRIEELENQLALRNAKALDAAAVRFVAPQGEVTLIHVEEDGFTAFENVWHRGQEIRIDAAAYERTKDRFGSSWVDTFLRDPNKQYATWGKVYIAPGPFVPRPGEVFNDYLAQEDERRRGAVPASLTQ